MRVRALRHTAVAASAGALIMAGLGLGATTAQAATVPPPTPFSEELHANANSSITMTWPAVPGATSYHVYRGTTAGGEGKIIDMLKGGLRKRFRNRER